MNELFYGRAWLAEEPELSTAHVQFFYERDLSIGPNWSGQDGSGEGIAATASPTALLHRGRHVLVLH